MIDFLIPALVIAFTPCVGIILIIGIVKKINKNKAA